MDDGTIVGDDEEEGSQGSQGSQGSGSAPLNATRNPILDMYEDSADTLGNFLQPIIYLNSQGFALMVTNELLVAFVGTLADILGTALGQEEEVSEVTEETLTSIVQEIMDYMSVGLYFDEDKEGNMSLQLNFTKEASEEETGDGGVFDSVGYSITLSLLQDSMLVISADTFNEYYRYMTEDEELMSYYDGCFNLDGETGVEWRFNLGLDITLAADLKEYILNWSSLFANEEDEYGNAVGAAFYIQALNDIVGDVTLRIKADVKLAALDQWAIDAMIQLVSLDDVDADGDGQLDVKEEYFGLYVVGSLHDPEGYEEHGLRLYMTMGALEKYGLAGIELNGDVFESFLNLNLRKLLDTLGGTIGNATGGIVTTLDDLIAQLGGLFEGLFGGDDTETPAEDPEVNPDETPSNAPDEEEGDDPFGYEDEEEPVPVDWYLGLFDSIQFTKGAISIVVARTALQTILKEVLNFPFEEKLGEIAVDLDNVENSLTLRFGLDYQEPIDVSDTEWDDVTVTIADESDAAAVVDELASNDYLKLGLTSPFLNDLTVSYDSVSYAVNATYGYIGNSEQAKMLGISNGNVRYVVYYPHSTFGTTDDAQDKARLIFNAVVSRFAGTATPSGETVYTSQQVRDGYYTFTSKLANYTNIAVKLSQNAPSDPTRYCVMVAVAYANTSLPTLNADNIEAYNLGDREFDAVAEAELLKEIREYEENFLVGAVIEDSDVGGTVAPKALSAALSYVRRQAIDDHDDFALENPGERSIYYLFYDPLSYYYFDASAYVDTPAGKEASLAKQKELADKLIVAITEKFRGKAYTYERDSRGIYTLYYHRTQLTVSAKVVAETDINGDTVRYYVMLGVSSSMSMFNFSLKIHNIDIGLTEVNIFETTPLGGEIRDGLEGRMPYQTYFDEYFEPLSSYKWEFELNSEIFIDDTVGGIFDMSELIGTIASLIGGDNPSAIVQALSRFNLAIQPIDDLAISIGFSVRGYIDFSDITNMRLQLEMTYNGKTMILITYIGGYDVDEYGNKVENSTIYADLGGMALPSIALPGIQIGSVLKNLIGGLTEGDGLSLGPDNASDNSGSAIDNGPSNATGDSSIDKVELPDYGWDDRLLLITLGKEETSIAITGALLYSLIYNIGGNEVFAGLLGEIHPAIPRFRNIKIGYSEEDGISSSYVLPTTLRTRRRSDSVILSPRVLRRSGRKPNALLPSPPTHTTSLTTPTE